MGSKDRGRRTCGQREGEQVRQEVAGKVSFALVQRGGDLPADLLRHLGTHHGGDALGRLLAHLRERTPGWGSLEVAGRYSNQSHESGLNLFERCLFCQRGLWTITVNCKDAEPGANRDVLLPHTQAKPTYAKLINQDTLATISLAPNFSKP